MSTSNRTYACVVCGALHRAPLPPQIRVQQSVQRAHLLGEVEETLVLPAPYGHWRRYRLVLGQPLPAWLHHCGMPMFLLGKRASQAATQLDNAERIVWLKLGARVTEHPGRKRWRPVLSSQAIKDAYPLT